MDGINNISLLEKLNYFKLSAAGSGPAITWCVLDVDVVCDFCHQGGSFIYSCRPACGTAIGQCILDVDVVCDFCHQGARSLINIAWRERIPICQPQPKIGPAATVQSSRLTLNGLFCGARNPVTRVLKVEVLAVCSGRGNRTDYRGRVGPV